MMTYSNCLLSSIPGRVLFPVRKPESKTVSLGSMCVNNVLKVVGHQGVTTRFKPYREFESRVVTTRFNPTGSLNHGMVLCIAARC